MRDEIFLFLLRIYLLTRLHRFLMCTIGLIAAICHLHLISTPLAIIVIGTCFDDLLEHYYSKKITKDSSAEEIAKIADKCYERQMAYYLFKIPTDKKKRGLQRGFVRELFMLTRQMKIEGKI